MAEGSSVSAHVIELNGYVQRLAALGVPFQTKIGTDITKSFPPRYDGFFMNSNMHGMNKTLTELFAMLKVAQKDIQKDNNHVMMVKKTTHFKQKVGHKKNGSSKGTSEAHTPRKSKIGSMRLLNLRKKSKVAHGKSFGDAYTPTTLAPTSECPRKLNHVLNHRKNLESSI
jgi:hypothetical protein